MTPVETLREAARLMRERAEGATPGPWATFFGVVRRQDGRDLFLTTNAGGYGDAPHVASWHPDVALAVASLLGREVHVAEVMAREHSDLPYQPDRNILAVAHAYLGETS